ncbi:MAG: histidine kinase [Flavobacteriia bacterium]|nr:histidine kinase [Flavobacteriia bacterium]
MYEKAILFSEKAINNFQKKKDYTSIFEATILISCSYSLMYNHTTEATAYIDKAIVLQQKHHISQSKGKIYYAKGLKYLEFGEFSHSYSYLIKALNIFEKEKIFFFITLTENALGKVLGMQHRFKPSDEYFNKSKIGFHKLKKYTLESFSFLNLNINKIHSKKYQEGINELLNAAEYYPNLKKGYGLYKIYNGLSQSYAYLGNYEKAIKYCEKGYEITGFLNLDAEQKDFITRIGYIYLAKKEPLKAKKYADLVIQYNKKNKTISNVVYYYNYLFLSEVSFANKEYQQAHNYRQISDVYRNKMLNEANDRRIAELKTIYETEKKDNEIRKKKNEIKYLEQQKETANFRFYFIILILFSITLIAVLFVTYLKSKIKREKIESTYQKELLELELSKKIKALEIQILHAQMNPHFVFNCLSAIQHLFMSGDKLLANSKLSSFSKLLRMSIDHVKNNFVSLEKEITFLNYYIDLEQLQFDLPFEYHFQNNCHHNLNDLEIPSMILQPFVENAINHGLRHKKTNCKLTIELEESEDNIIILIEDNGIGRKEALRLKNLSSFTHESKGLMLVKEKIQALKEINGISIEVETIDKFDEFNSSIGTKVKIVIPN